MRRFRRFLISASHARLAQLVARMRLIASRRIRSQLSARSRSTLRRRAEAIAGDIAIAAVPRPFPPRGGMFRRDAAGITLRFLNHEHAFPRSIDWSIARRGGVPQLWGFHLHYQEFLEECGPDDFRTIVLDWIASNPPYLPRYWFDAWSSYALSLRIVVWMQQLNRRRDELDAEFLPAVARSVVEQALFLESNLETDLCGNHLIKNIKALLFAARFVGGDAGRRWTSRAVALLPRELDEQILPDGVHFERSPAYHAQVFADLVECHEVLESGALKDRLRSRLAAMAQALADLTHPDGLASLFNDGGLHMAYAPADLLAAWRAISGEAPAARPAVMFQAAGYFGVREGDDFLLMDAGRIGPDVLPAHGHGDILAFEWTVGGRRLVVDTGVFEYEAGPLRDRSRATASHNTVTVDGSDQCEFYGSFRVARRARVTVEHAAVDGGILDVTASHDGFTRLDGAGVHRRSVRGRAGAFTIDDVLEGRRGIADAWLIVHPEATVTIDGTTATIRRDGIVAEIAASAPIEIAPWQWWPDFGVARETTRLQIRYGPLPATGRLAFKVTARQ